MWLPLWLDWKKTTVKYISSMKTECDYLYGWIEKKKPVKYISSMKTECDYLCGWMEKKNQTNIQKCHPKWWSPEIQVELQKREKTPVTWPVNSSGFVIRCLVLEGQFWDWLTHLRLLLLGEMTNLFCISVWQHIHLCEQTHRWTLVWADPSLKCTFMLVGLSAKNQPTNKQI